MAASSRTAFRRLKIAALALLVPCLAAGAGWLYLRRSLPQLSGEARVTGLARPVEIVRDRHGVPHVFAQRELDAYFALGYVHAQDRLWQLELNRRAGSGSLAEVFGPELLSEDRLLRTIGLRRAAEQNLPALDRTARAVLDAYSRGVNALLAEQRPLPPEFALLGVTPAPWQPADSLVVLKLMAWSLSGQLRRELLRVRLGRVLGAARANDLIGELPAGLELDAASGALAPAAAQILARAGLGRANAVGSNSWAIAGARTQSGKPLLANDPHMDLSAPALWYLAHLDAPGLRVIGATVPGLPGVILGRTTQVAWGFTNARADALDLYLERLDPADASRYLTPDGSAPFTTVRELIRVKGEPDQELRVRLSRHGPIVSDAFEEARAVMPEGHVLALAYAALRADDHTMQFPIQAAHADNVDALLRAARDFHSPPQNIVAADTAGAIAFVAAGRVPLRAPENELRGLVPMPGWLARYDWSGFIPFEELPAVRDPASGRIVTANQDLRPPAYPHWLSADWASPQRAERIASLLDRRADHSAATQARIQLDVRSGWAAALVPQLLRMLPAREETRAARDALAAWDFELSEQRLEPLLFAAWLRELGRLVYEDELGALFPELWAETPDRLEGVLRDRDGQARWCDDVHTPAGESCAELVARAFERALASLESDGERWGDLHVARFAHVPFGEVPVLSRWFDVLIPSAGGSETVNLGEYFVDDPDQPFTSRSGPAFRAIYDLADPEHSQFMLAPGQSGHVLSPLYRDGVERWAKGEFIPMVTAREVVERGALGRLTLRPR